MFKAPYFSLRGNCERGRRISCATYCPRLQIPVPIEHIVEFRFEIDIVPMPGLQEGFDVVAFLTKDLREIRVDDYVYRRRPTRYRFSLAHELAHRVLHSEVWREISFDDVASWKAFVTDSIPEKEYSYLEFHANFFAGQILVPSSELAPRFRECVRMAKDAGIDVSDEATGVREAIEGNLGRQFEVLSDVVHRRVEADSLWAEL